MSERAKMRGPQFFEHAGKRLLLLDYSQLSPPEIVAFMHEAGKVIGAEPRGSVRLLSVVPAQVTSEVIKALNEFAARNAPFVMASSIVGGSPFQKAAIMLAIVGQGRLNIEAFDDEQTAKDWLVSR